MIYWLHQSYNPAPSSASPGSARLAAVVLRKLRYRRFPVQQAREQHLGRHGDATRFRLLPHHYFKRNPRPLPRNSVTCYITVSYSGRPQTRQIPDARFVYFFNSLWHIRAHCRNIFPCDAPVDYYVLGQLHKNQAIRTRRHGELKFAS